MTRKLLSALIVFFSHSTWASEVSVDRMEYAALLKTVEEANRIIAGMIAGAETAPDPSLIRTYTINVGLYLSTQMNESPAVVVRRDQICDQASDLSEVGATFDRYRNQYSEEEQKITALSIASSKQLVGSLGVSCETESEREVWNKKLQDHKKKRMDAE